MSNQEVQGRERWSKLLDELKQQDRALEGIGDCEFLERGGKIQRLLTWGILNPFGPTVNSLCLAAAPTGENGVLFAKMSNPFANSTVAYGAFGDDSHGGLVQPVMTATASITGATLVIPATQGAGKQLDMFAVVWRQMNAGNAPDLSSESHRLRQFWLDPWSRLPSMEEMLKSRSCPPSRERREISKALFAEWWALVTHPQHVICEWRAIIEAWHGAIEFQRSPRSTGLADIAMPPEQALAFHRRLLNAEMGLAARSE
jgi:hypothetical protein